MIITVDRARSLLEYDPATGFVTWRVARGRVPAGRQAGFLSNGYIDVRIDGVQYGLHRVIWLLHYGVWPVDHIDHLNGCRSDNRIENLRCVSVSMNMRNRVRSSNNRSGVTGVFWNAGKGRWTARIKVDGKNRHLGHFTSKDEARAARAAAERDLGFTERHGTVPPDKFAFEPRREKAA